MKYRSLVFAALFLVLPVFVFAQQQTAALPPAVALRNFVGLINQTYHPGIVSIFENTKELLRRRGETAAVRAIEVFLRGDVGSGFLYSDARGNMYVITNNHVVSHAHTLAITFEAPDGTRRKVENLRIIATDEENDLAILSVPRGEAPVTAGLRFITRNVSEGEDVFAAGFPGLGITPLWQFSRGMVSNAFARFPRSLVDETLMGPFIQHTAPIDPGNSGGPLLVIQQGAPSGYAVAGINTLTGTRRQAANFAVPASTALAFIESALNPRPETFRAALDERLDKFTEGLSANRAVFPHIAEFLSTECIGENAEYAIEEMFNRGTPAARRAFIEKAEESIVSAMGLAVAWTIENSIRRGGVIRASVKEVTGEDEKYTVVFTINNEDVSTTWIREHGNWRIRTFGTVAAGDRSLISQRHAQRERDANLRLNSNFHIETGYAHIFFEDSTSLPAFYASIEFSGGFWGLKTYVAQGFWAAGVFAGYRFSIPLGSFGFNPYFRIGFDYLSVSDNEDAFLGLPFAFNFQTGVKAMTASVPGLFMGFGFQFNPNIFGILGDDSPRSGRRMRAALAITAGYAF